MDRQPLRLIPGQSVSDGAGVRLHRSIGASPALRLDPFLMLDEFYSDNPDDYLAGFPAHPHRGFETVTYMLEGRMQHRDHLGNTGDLGPGGVQWMTAGRGVIHEEMPQQREGRMRGFQLWLNLPAKDKLRPADYRDLPAESIPEQAGDGWRLRLIAGRVDALVGAVDQTLGARETAPLYVDLHLAAGGEHRLPVPLGHQAFIYLYDGDAAIGGTALRPRAVNVLSDGDRVQLHSTNGGRLLLIAGKPLQEPIAQYGPFVMNSSAEIEQALRDYQAGTLTA